MWKTLTCRALCFFWILSDYRFRCMHELSAKTTLVHRKPIRVNWKFSSLLCVGHTKRRRINQDCYFFSIGIYPHLQPIGVECAVRVYPTLEKGKPRAKLSKSRNIKNAVAAFVQRMVLGKAFQSSLLCRRVFFSSGNKSIDFGQIQRIQTSSDSPTSYASRSA